MLRIIKGVSNVLVGCYSIEPTSATEKCPPQCPSGVTEIKILPNNEKETVIQEVVVTGKSNSNDSGPASLAMMALYVSQVDSPAPGPGDIVAAAMLITAGIWWTWDHYTQPSYTTIADPSAGYGSMNSDSDAEKDTNGVEVPKEGKPDARTEPKDLEEQLTLEEAKAGAGEKIMTKPGQLKDPKYHPETGTHDKMGHVHDHGDGTKTDVHYDRNRATGERSGFKIKDGTNARSRGH